MDTLAPDVGAGLPLACHVVSSAARDIASSSPATVSVTLSKVDAALQGVAPPFGRGEVIDADGQPLELVLVKNPAGFTVALGTYGNAPVTTMVAINDNYADGRDVSWLYDVSFESLRDKGVALTCGVRAYDMALRLTYDDVAVAEVEPDLAVALERFLTAYGNEPKRIFCTYTAMMVPHTFGRPFSWLAPKKAAPTAVNSSGGPTELL